MKMALSKNRPKEMSKEEFEKSWNNIGYSLSALYKVCQEELDRLGKVKEEDFGVANHYALLAFKQGKKEMLEEIISYLPETAKTT